MQTVKKKTTVAELIERLMRARGITSWEAATEGGLQKRIESSLTLIVSTSKAVSQNNIHNVCSEWVDESDGRQNCDVRLCTKCAVSEENLTKNVTLERK